MLTVGWVRRYEVWKVKYILKFNTVCIQMRSWNSWKSQSHSGPVAQILISQPHSCENVLSAHPHNNSTYEPGWQPGTMFWCHESLPLALSCSYACARVMIPTHSRLNKTHWGMCNSHIHGPPSPCSCGSLGAQAKAADDLRIWTPQHRLEVLSFWLQRRFSLWNEEEMCSPFLVPYHLRCPTRGFEGKD